MTANPSVNADARTAALRLLFVRRLRAVHRMTNEGEVKEQLEVWSRVVGEVGIKPE